MEWISVEDRLPTITQKKYLTFRIDKKISVLVFKRNHFRDGLDKAHNVTHWMPLPEPPQEVK